MTEPQDGRDPVPAGSPMPYPLDGSFVPERRRSVATYEVDGQAILLEGTTGALQLLDPVATTVWSLLDGERGVDDLVADLGAMYGADAEQVRGDVVDFVGVLGRGGLLEGSTGDEPPGDGYVDPTSRPGRRADPDPTEPRFLAEPPSS